MREKEIVRFGGNGRRSKCVVHGGLIYISGITTVDLQADTKGQTTDVLEQIDKLLASCGSKKENVLSASICLSNIANYGDFNSVWDQWATDGYEPARNVFEGKLELEEYLVKIAIIAAQ